MYDKKATKLIIGQALLFSIVIIFFGFIIIREKVPFFKAKDEEAAIKEYFEDNYSDLEVVSGDLEYNKDNNSYSITYYNKDYEELNFTITSLNNKITDNYEENYVEGKTIIENAAVSVLNKYKEIFDNTSYQDIKIVFKNLNEYSSDEIIDILEDNIYNTGYFTVSYYVKVDSLDETYLNNLINSFNTIAIDNGLVTNNYSVTFDNDGIIKIVKGGENYE